VGGGSAQAESRPIADGVDVDLDGVGEEPIDQDRTFGRQTALLAQAAESGEFVHRTSKVVAVVDDLHRPSTEYVAGADEHRKSDVVGDRERLLEVDGSATGGLRDLQLVADRVPSLAIFRSVDRVG